MRFQPVVEDRKSLARGRDGGGFGTGKGKALLGAFAGSKNGVPEGNGALGVCMFQTPAV